MRDDIQHQLQSWLNSPEHAHYVDTLCLAQDFGAEALPPAWLLHDDDEATQALVMIDINTLPAEMRANLGATDEDGDMAGCDSRVLLSL